ncbi:WD40 repeat domain-containing protein [Deinococcus xinjiangensis]|uniref:WD40 repeat domain-containing protein n=1 Tax=Deinococcus xinjiangensis TaxID=457454 RepID=UPI0033658521
MQDFSWNRRYVRGLDFHPHLSLLATAFSDGVVKLWHPSSGREILTVGEEENDADGVFFAHDGAFFAVNHSDKVVRYYLK